MSQHHSSLSLSLVTPVTTAAVEQANSSLDFIKSDRCSAITESRLNAMLRLFVHKDISLELHKVVTLYANKHPRGMLRCRPLDA